MVSMESITRPLNCTNNSNETHSIFYKTYLHIMSTFKTAKQTNEWIKIKKKQFLLPIVQVHLLTIEYDKYRRGREEKKGAGRRSVFYGAYRSRPISCIHTYLNGMSWIEEKKKLSEIIMQHQRRQIKKKLKRTNKIPNWVRKKESKIDKHTIVWIWMWPMSMSHAQRQTEKNTNQPKSNFCPIKYNNFLINFSDGEQTQQQTLCISVFAKKIAIYYFNVSEYKTNGAGTGTGMKTEPALLGHSSAAERMVNSRVDVNAPKLGKKKTKNLFMKWIVGMQCFLTN